MPPRTRAGDRNPKFRPGHGRIADSKFMILRTKTTKQLAVQMRDPLEDDPEGMKLVSEAGDTFLLYIQIPGRTRPLVWDFSGMTLEELEATRQFFNHLFDLTEPVVRERDKVAQDAFAKGDDSYDRVYRPVPQLIVRERVQQEHDQGVLGGPEGIPVGDGDDSSQE